MTHYSKKKNIRQIHGLVRVYFDVITIQSSHDSVINNYEHRESNISNKLIFLKPGIQACTSDFILKHCKGF